MALSKRLSRVFDALLIVGLLLTFWRFTGWWPMRARASPAPPLEVGQVFEPPGVDWTRADRHLVLVISPTCPTCEKSARFYRTLSDTAAADRALGVVVVGAESPSELTGWLAEKQIAADQLIHTARPSALGVIAVPTVLLVDRTGTVTDIIERGMPPSLEARVLSRIRNPSDPPVAVTYHPKEIGEGELAALLQRNPQFLDLRDRVAFGRSHRQRAINIPLDELNVRGRIELSKAAPVVIDCTTYAAPPCRAAAEALQDEGFDVSIVMPGR